ncbi:hypothetical protein [Sporosarcina sp. Marseille-Q4943]|uniref:hypothetical protein n=1 Tax=Sporosarcina sp. Marseille-Q4943 TaxID=2942204 RepID=UPI00208DBA4D|nr:hypothetical protein [Sporosarcina sp. Marseille-Q4943]
MSKVEIAQTVILILGFLGVGFIPQYFYEKKLNNLKNDIRKLNISMEQNHPIKMERYKDFVENFFEYGKLNNEKQKQKKLLESFKSIANAVFLFGSDETMKAFLILREGISETPTEDEKMEYLVKAARFMVELRKDLNGGKTDIGPEDYLKLLINDWEDSKDKIRKFL